MVEQPATDC